MVWICKKCGCYVYDGLTFEHWANIHYGIDPTSKESQRLRKVFDKNLDDYYTPTVSHTSGRANLRNDQDRNRRN